MRSLYLSATLLHAMALNLHVFPLAPIHTQFLLKRHAEEGLFLLHGNNVLATDDKVKSEHLTQNYKSKQNIG